jgi:hypothetical protein
VEKPHGAGAVDLPGFGELWGTARGLNSALSNIAVGHPTNTQKFIIVSILPNVLIIMRLSFGLALGVFL